MTTALEAEVETLRTRVKLLEGHRRKWFIRAWQAQALLFERDPRKAEELVEGWEKKP